MKFDLTGIFMLVAGLLFVDHGVEGKPDPNSGGRTALQCYQCADGDCKIQTCSAGDACLTMKVEDNEIKMCTPLAICNLTAGMQAISGVGLLAPLGEELLAPLGEELLAPLGEELLAPLGEELLAPLAEELPAPLAEELPVKRTITCCHTNLCNKGTSAGHSVLAALLPVGLFCLLFI